MLRNNANPKEDRREQEGWSQKSQVPKNEALTFTKWPVLWNFVNGGHCGCGG